ncbi:hypothetical protein CLM62_09480 [Streptomyces sp. SA15]|uniref:PIN domain-containing protein n=1 Tax=Streptomyces sp. SA15 TaxID=934019 RepID=UPI000BB0772C|nr:PIN domain-containing protein [Streptomyces sp. SA15]PAZ16212.1 hypothetical protein CLM62_09480 [Streptomyces sp. SA15]
MDELASARRRPLYQRGPLRRALLDTSVLTTDIIAATRRLAPSSFVAGARAGTVRCLIPVHVWEEVPRVLADRHREGGRFDLGRALELWQSRYAPVLYVVDTAGLPMTPQAQVLAGRDASDVPMLLLAGVIAPVVIIGTDADLVDSGLADADWVALRSALGDVGVTEGRMADLERQANVLLRCARDPHVWGQDVSERGTWRGRWERPPRVWGGHSPRVEAVQAFGQNSTCVGTMRKRMRMSVMIRTDPHVSGEN